MFRPTWLAESAVAPSPAPRIGGVAVLERDRVLAMSVAARAAGVRPGMRRSSALALAPDIDFRERDTVLEEAARQGLAIALMQYSPQVALLPEATVLVDVSASLRLFGGVLALHRQVRATVRACGLTARISVAPTGAGASILARAGAGHALRIDAASRKGNDRTDATAKGQAPSIQRRTLESVLSTLPLMLLPAARPFAPWFTGLGCSTLGDIRKLPRAGLKRRCGEDFLDALDRAVGGASEWYEWLMLPEHFDIRQELPDRVDDASAMVGWATGLLAQLIGWLTARQLAVTRIVFFLEHERGRQTIPPTEVAIALAEPTWQHKHLVRLLTERLAHITLGAAVIAVRLEAHALEPAVPPSATLFPEPGGSLTDHRRLLELLNARLGLGAVLHASPQADHRPDIANHWDVAVPSLKTNNAALPPRPSWLLTTPMPLLTRHHRPFYGSPLRVVSPCERIEAGWWSDASISRDYFVAEADDRSCYWIFCERRPIRDAERDEKDERWYLHGFFG